MFKWMKSEKGYLEFSRLANQFLHLDKEALRELSKEEKELSKKDFRAVRKQIEELRHTIFLSAEKLRELIEIIKNDFYKYLVIDPPVMKNIKDKCNEIHETLVNNAVLLRDNPNFIPEDKAEIMADDFKNIRDLVVSMEKSILDLEETKDIKKMLERDEKKKRAEEVRAQSQKLILDLSSEAANTKKRIRGTIRAMELRLTALKDENGNPILFSSRARMQLRSKEIREVVVGIIDKLLKLTNLKERELYKRPKRPTKFLCLGSGRDVRVLFVEDKGKIKVCSLFPKHNDNYERYLSHVPFEDYAGWDTLKEKDLP